jgi:Secretion system C-terminal sorting domain
MINVFRSTKVLKGDGVGKTFLLNTSYQMNDKAIISVSGSSSSTWTTIPSSKALLTKDVMNPISTLSVDNTSLFKVGDLVVVRNTINDAWITEHKETEWLGAGNSLKGIMYCRHITAIDVTNKTITIDLPVRYALKTRDAACIYKISGMISEVGLQDFSIANVQHPGTTGWAEEDYTTSTNSSFDCANSFVIKYSTVVNSWIKNIETYQPVSNTTKTHMLSNGIFVQFSKGVTIDNCKMSYAQFGGGGGNGYAYRISANEVLISNSTASYVRHGLVFSSMWCSGNVFYNCKDINSGFQTGNTGNMKTSGWGSDHHMHFSQSNLIDQCYSENSAFVAFYRPFGSDPMHNLTSTHSTFWNTSTGGNKGFCVWTQQSRFGYAIGSSGSSFDFKTNENSKGSAAKTDPVDIAEGPGKGTTLIPQSLFKDQLNRRLNPVKIKSLQLINAANESVVLGYDNLIGKSIIDKTNLNIVNYNIFAQPSEAIDSIVFIHTYGAVTTRSKEGVSPYALRGDGSGYTLWNLPLGNHVVETVAYKDGVASDVVKLTFKVINESITAVHLSGTSQLLELYPNPVTHLLTLSHSVAWELINIDGDTIKKDFGDVVDMSTYVKGVYIVKVGSENYKVMKE